VAAGVAGYDFPSVVDTVECGVVVQALARRAAIELAVPFTLSEMRDAINRRHLEIGRRYGPRRSRHGSPLALWWKRFGPRHLRRARADDVRRLRRTARAAGWRHQGIQLLLRQLTYDGTRLVTRVEAASDPSRIGSDQVRGVRFEGERMVLIPPPRRAGESEEHREITWERIAAE